MNQILIADYLEPRGKLRGLAAPDCNLRAAFLEGGAHYGKTFLLNCLKSEVSVRVILIPLDKRRSVPTPLQLLAEIANQVGWEHLPNLDRVMGAQQRPIHAHIHDVTVKGSYVNVEAVARETEDDRLITAIRVTAAFLDDLRSLPGELQPLILAFDGYDASLSLIDRWFESTLVQGLSEIEHVRLIVCGRQVSPTTVKQRTAAERSIDVLLTGVTDEQEWMQIIAALKCRIPGEDDRSQTGYVRGVVNAFKGAPGLIVAHLKILSGD